MEQGVQSQEPPNSLDFAGVYRDQNPGLRHGFPSSMLITHCCGLQVALHVARHTLSKGHDLVACSGHGKTTPSIPLRLKHYETI